MLASCSFRHAFSAGIDMVPVMLTAIAVASIIQFVASRRWRWWRWFIPVVPVLAAGLMIGVSTDSHSHADGDHPVPAGTGGIDPAGPGRFLLR